MIRPIERLPPDPPPGPPEPNRLPAAMPWWRRPDPRNLALIAGAAILLLLILSPAHNYPISDDWVYADSVQHQLATGAFRMPTSSQANLVGQTLWGTLWTRLFGFSYTTLAASTLALAVGGLFAFYGLARQVGVPPTAALLGTALLGGNPIFLHLGDSFMTDVPFLALLLIAAYGYMRALNGAGPAWFLLGGLFTGWAFLIRQYGVLLPAGLLGYLGLEALRTRQIPWRAVLGVVAVPLLVVTGWALWARGLPPTPGAQTRPEFLLAEPWLRVFLLRCLAILPLTALAAPVALPLRRGRRWLLLVWGGIAAAGLFWAGTVHESWIPTEVPSVPLHLGPVTVDLPQQINTFAAVGNVLRTTGLDFYAYIQEPLWTQETWQGLWLVAVGFAVVLLAQMSAALLDWRPLGRAAAPLPPITGLYLTAGLIFVPSLAGTSDFFDRYLLGWLPFVLLFALRGAATWSRRAWAYTAVTTAAMVLAGLFFQADAVDHDNARWAAARWLNARVRPVHMGYDWDKHVPVPSGPYEVADVPIPGYRVEQHFPYLSRMAGFAPRAVRAQARTSAPPLPPPRVPAQPP